MSSISKRLAPFVLVLASVGVSANISAVVAATARTDLPPLKGTVLKVETAHIVTVTGANGHRYVVDAYPSTVITLDGKPVALDALTKGDDVTVETISNVFSFSIQVKATRIAATKPS